MAAAGPGISLRLDVFLYMYAHADNAWHMRNNYRHVCIYRHILSARVLSTHESLFLTYDEDWSWNYNLPQQLFLYARLSLYLSLHLHIWLSVYLSIRIYIYIYILSVYPHIYIYIHV